MSIAPIRMEVTVPVPPDAAFALFTGRIGEWWQRSKSIGDKPWAEVVIEPRQDGRWFERDAEGAETPWGDVLAWEPPGRLLLAWRIGADFRFDPQLETEVELRFLPDGESGTRVSLEHRKLQRFGDAAERVAAQLGGGWPGLVASFAKLAEEENRS